MMRHLCCSILPGSLNKREQDGLQCACQKAEEAGQSLGEDKAFLAQNSEQNFSCRVLSRDMISETLEPETHFSKLTFGFLAEKLRKKRKSLNTASGFTAVKCTLRHCCCQMSKGFVREHSSH